ncbi:nitrile hydratase subunit alpha [Ruegeria jejuensis]|uniref:nitrile hydratase subunit alpha n=1 Tax=Ruegeria jejuensis TaxID=3233338 RepID=UPI00355AFF2D
MAQTINEIQKARFLDKVWNDDAYRARLQEEPKAALAEFGADVPDDVNIECVMDTDKVKYLHIPAAPPQGEISDKDLVDAQGGTTVVCVATSISLATIASVSVTTNQA